MNKNTKIWVNYVAGATVSAYLLYSIYDQLAAQWRQLQHSGGYAIINDYNFLYLAVALMFANTSLEAYKWYVLTRSVGSAPYHKVFASYLAGIAFSIVTPNRVGEYPGRIVYLGTANTLRYVNVSVLGVMSQLLAVYVFGCCGLIYYNIMFPGLLPLAALAFCIVAAIVLVSVFLRFEDWLPLMARFRMFRKFAVYGRLVNRLTFKKQFILTALSLLRFAIFTAQFLFLLRATGVRLPWFSGYCMCALFFWVMAVIPTIALTELGIRGKVSLWLFGHFSANSIGIVAASAGLWALNLVVPAIAGSLLIIKIKFLR